MSDEQRDYTKPDSNPAHASDFHSRLERRTFLLLLLLVSLAFILLLKPFFNAIFWACVIGILFFPLNQRLVRKWQRPNVAALATLGITMLVAVVPALFIIASFVQEGAEIYQRIQSGEINPAQYVERIRDGLPAVQQFTERFNIDLTTVKEQLSNAAISLSQFAASNAVQIGQNTLQFFVSLGLMLYVAFFMLRDGNRLTDLLIRALPIGDDRERQLFRKFTEVTRATIKGNLVVAAIQGSLGGIVFAILGIPGAVLWGVVMTVLSLIPVVGAGLIWVPVAIYLFAIGNWGEALVLTGFGALVIGLVDNVLRPILVGRDTKLPDYLVLLSTLGGFVLFGINGFVIGPLVAALFVAFWQIFMQEFNTSPDRSQPEETADDKES